MKKIVLLLSALTATASAQSVQTTSEIGQFEGGAWTKSDKLPPAIHNSGEAIRGGYVAPDGTQFLTGYDYTGVSGADTGVVYRKDPKGAWKIVFSKRENQLGNLWGTSSTDVYASGVRALVHWDGKAWSEISIPDVKGTFGGGWTDGKQLFVTTSDYASKKSWIYRRDEKGTWTIDGTGEMSVLDVGGTTDALYACSLDGAILHRVKAGTWNAEQTKKSGQNTEIWASGPKDIYVTGSTLLHSKGDGKWTEVALPIKAQVLNVWGRSANDVYVGTLAGLVHFDGKAWSKTGWTHDTEAIAGNDKLVLVANQHM